MLVQKQGICKYCNQYRVIEVPEDFTAAMIDAEVTKKCNCEKAIMENAMLETIAHTELQIKEMFKGKDDLSTMRDKALATVDDMARFRLAKLSMGYDAYTFTMKRKSSGISLSLKYSEEQKRE